jgi:hypothetical protein
MRNQYIVTYVIFALILFFLIVEIRSYLKNKKRGYGYTIRPVRIIASVIVLLMALYAILTGQTLTSIQLQLEKLF